MDEILHANIFFFVATVATVVFMILISVILYHVLRIIKSIRRIIEKIEAGSEILAGDISDLRAQFMNGGFISRLLALFMGFSNSYHSDDDEEEDRPKRRSSRKRRARVRDADDE
ncbi:MAG: hypothetical protein H6779_04980 [Candidatus Nomurabacteria bacterium]|nr:hypothetical protein [Candidatus Nomurabacteria bacterium]USN87722.1 MAG: hypothetical protein H6779_04980 [Candidatus Nomurabacteria bacterium]